MKRKSRRKFVYLAALISVMIISPAVIWFYFVRAEYRLPFQARFTPGADNRWTAFGGVWDIENGSMRNEANDRGAKILIGSPNWKDYTVEGDLQLLGSGSAGLLARISDADVGEDSYRGYLAGVRSVDNSLFLAAVDFAYHETSKVSFPEPVHLFRWYHVKLTVNGCRIEASASAPGLPDLRTPPLNDPDCFRSGLIGLRSNGTGGIWRNVVVSRVNSSHSAAPKNDQSAQLPESLRRSSTRAADVQPIRSLKYLSPVGSPQATVRGSVVLTHPAIYLEDSTGGVEVQPSGNVPLKIGDTVEVTGRVDLNAFGPVIRDPQFVVSGESVPIPPAVLTPNQVANGSDDGRFVQVEGLLRSIKVEDSGALILNMELGTQSFRALFPPGRSLSRLRHLAAQSRLRVKGVAVVNPRFNQDVDPFVILARSPEDVEVIAGPPWWRPSNLILAIVIALGLLFALNYLFLLAKHWRLRAVAEERERLAHEIHDSLAQSFAGIGFQLQAIRNSIPGDDSFLRKQVEQAMSMARTSHEEARRGIASLRPTSLGSTGLISALRECAESMVKNGNLTVKTSGEDEGRIASPRIKDTLFRIGQEAIANSIRHSGAGVIRIGLRQQGPSFCLSVEDDGGGFTPDSDQAGFGLLGMRKRAESIDATLVVRSSPGGGTRIEVRAATGWRLRSLLTRRKK